VGVSIKGRSVLERAYGMADLEHDVKNAPDTIFEAGSVSKQFTAAAVLLIAREGKLSLDDPVRKHIPELPDYGAPLTIRHMLTHTSGSATGCSTTMRSAFESCPTRECEIGHSGSTAGYRAYLADYPDQGVSVAVLCNVSSGNAAQYAHAVADLYIGSAISTEASTGRGQRGAGDGGRAAGSCTLTPAELDAAAGSYRDTNTGEPLRLIREVDSDMKRNHETAERCSKGVAKLTWPASLEKQRVRQI
jgi:CubicO group peptidase (beta-lactamase class C family)